MSDMTAEKLGQRITDAGLLDSRQLEGVWGELGTREVSVDQFTSLLMRRDLLTNFQLDRLIKGERSGYFYGNYRVLYLTGTGGDDSLTIPRQRGSKEGKHRTRPRGRRQFQRDRASILIRGDGDRCGFDAE